MHRTNQMKITKWTLKMIQMRTLIVWMKMQRRMMTSMKPLSDFVLVQTKLVVAMVLTEEDLGKDTVEDSVEDLITPEGTPQKEKADLIIQERTALMEMRKKRTPVTWKCLDLSHSDQGEEEDTEDAEKITAVK